MQHLLEFIPELLEISRIEQHKRSVPEMHDQARVRLGNGQFNRSLLSICRDACALSDERGVPGVARLTLESFGFQS